MLILIENGYSKTIIYTEEIIFPEQIFAVKANTIDDKTKYVTEGEVKVSIVRDEAFVISSSEEGERHYRTLIEKADEEADRYRDRAWKAERERDTLKKELETIKSTCSSVKEHE
jgi:hypothetical protein